MKRIVFITYIMIEYKGDSFSLERKVVFMKNKNQLMKELDSFTYFVSSLADLTEDVLTTPLFEDVSIKDMLISVYEQDKMYLEYYFPQMQKDAKIQEYTDGFLVLNTEQLHIHTPIDNVIRTLTQTRKQIIYFINSISQERIHAFFEIEGVKFTMYDHLEHIIWNDQIQRDEILRGII